MFTKISIVNKLIVEISMRCLCLFLAILSLVACQDKGRKVCNKEVQVANIDISSLRTIEWGKLFDLSSLQVIPLETTSESIFGKVARFFVGDSMFCVMTDSAVLIFDLEGHFVKKLSKKGRGPGEYLVLKDIWIDEKQDLYLLDCHGKKILNYNKVDSCKMSIPTDLLGRTFAPLKDDIWAIYIDSDTRESSNCRLNLFSLSRKKIIGKFQPVTENEKEWRYFINKNNFIKYDSTLFFHCAFNDTIFRVGGEKLEPAMIINYGKYNLPSYLLHRKYESIAEINELVEKNNWVFLNDWIYFTSEGMFLGFLYNGRTYHAYYKDGKSVAVNIYQDYLGLKNYFVPSNLAMIPLAYKDGFLYSLINPIRIKEEFQKEFAEKYGIEKFDEEANAYVLKYKLNKRIDIFEN